MSGNCSQPFCNPDETGCNIEGCDNVKDCKHYKKTESVQSDVPIDEIDSYRVPWTGNTFGLVDLNVLSAVSKPVLIGITGATSAGKTTFLATLYCLLRNGRHIGEYQFAGSLTLIGWENIAYYLSWKENGDIKFPPHTSFTEGRVPGLLHIALRNADGKKLDLIFTDAPGEWFDHWRINKDASNAVGAKWIHDKANAFLLFADCESLADNESKGKTRLQIRSVADRILENIEVKPFGLIWSKSDIVISDNTKTQISEYLTKHNIHHYNEFNTSVTEGENGKFHSDVCESINWVINKIQSNVNCMKELPSFKPEDMFLSKR